jgi:hypothetical protein
MLYILVLILEDSSGSSSAQSSRSLQVVDLKFESLGTTSIPEAIVYLDNDHVFIGSHLGDSQLVLLHTEPDQHGEYLEVMETFTNIAPITDFEVVDLEGQGQVGLYFSSSPTPSLLRAISHDCLLVNTDFISFRVKLSHVPERSKTVPLGLFATVLALTIEQCWNFQESKGYGH